MKNYGTKHWHQGTFYNNSHVMGYGNKAIFFILIGGRGIGKTYSTQNYCLKRFFKYGEKSLWLRLKQPSVQALLANNAKDFLDTDLITKYKITGIKTEGNSVFITRGDPNDKKSYKEFCKVLSLSTFYIMKGVALNKKGEEKEKDMKIDDKTSKNMIKRNLAKYKNIVLDEMNQEKSEKKTFNITYAFVNTLETVCRNDTDRRIILSANLLEEGSDILANCFNFIPNQFGTYYLKKKRAVIDYIDDSAKFKADRKKSIAGILTPEESTFTNKIESDIALITGKTSEPISYVIKFAKKQFVVRGSTVTQDKVSKQAKVFVVSMEPYLTGIPYYKERAQQVIERAQQRLYNFDMLITMKQFYTELQLLKNK